MFREIFGKVFFFKFSFFYFSKNNSHFYESSSSYSAIVIFQNSVILIDTCHISIEEKENIIASHLFYKKLMFLFQN